MRRRDLAGLAAVLLTGAGLHAFRQIWFEPRAVGLACLHGTAPRGLCAARDLLGQLTYRQVFGDAALVLGIAAMAGAPFAVAVAAVCLGVAGLIDYNVSWGMLGVGLGAWAWISPVVDRPGFGRLPSAGPVSPAVR